MSKKPDDIPVIPEKPVIPEITPWIPTYTPTQPNPIVAECGACGLNLHAVMGYVCPRPDCPCGMAGPTSTLG